VTVRRRAAFGAPPDAPCATKIEVTGEVAMVRNSARGRGVALLAAALALALTAAACSTSSSHSATPAVSAPAAGGDDMSGMPGMSDVPLPTAPAVADAAVDGTGLSGALSGYTLVSTGTVAAGAASTFSFHISGPDGRTVTRYQPYESKLTLFYLVRSDLTNYQYLESTMRQDGTWDVSMPALTPGTYRAYVTFAAPDAGEGTPLMYVLSRPFTVPGTSAEVALPAPTTSTTADGYTVAIAGDLRAAQSVPLAIRIEDKGKPVSIFTRILDGYAHLTAFHEGDMAFARILSTGRTSADNGAGPLTAQALFPESGTWRLFVQFELGTTMHTAAFTVNVPS
jgi:hypothetical protein